VKSCQNFRHAASEAFRQLRNSQGSVCKPVALQVNVTLDVGSKTQLLSQEGLIREKFAAHVPVILTDQKV